jgi:hypothetical protein
VRVDVDGFRRSQCAKCGKFTGAKMEFGKCPASKSDIYRCAYQKSMRVIKEGADD